MKCSGELKAMKVWLQNFKFYFSCDFSARESFYLQSVTVTFSVARKSREKQKLSLAVFTIRSE